MPAAGEGAWGARESAAWIAVPGTADDKYSRGVLGVVTGSTLFPGAAVLGVSAAWRAGVGMVRYLGEPTPTSLVLQRRPETVTAPGRVQAWLLGSGIDGEAAGSATRRLWSDALASGLPTVVDAGALSALSPIEPGSVPRPWVLTPHHRELARLLGRPSDGRAGSEGHTGADLAPARPAPHPDVAAVAQDPARWASVAARRFGAVVLLKGATTHLASPGGGETQVRTDCGWLATAGTGDVLGGILGALLATHPAAGVEDLLPLAATAACLHGLAALRASGGGPITALDVAEALPATIAALLAEPGVSQSAGASSSRRS